MPTDSVDAIASSSCCIVVPVHTINWSAEEKTAMVVCLRKLAAYDFVFVHKESISSETILHSCLFDTPKDVSLKFMPVCDAELSSIAAYNRLLLSLWFYQAFAEWEYMLLFQLDAWILNGDLKSWIEKSYSYVGAPWASNLGPDKNCPHIGVGNGGLSLRCIRDMIKVLCSSEFSQRPVLGLGELINKNYLFCRYDHRHILLWPLIFSKRLKNTVLMACGWKNTLKFFVCTGEHEDIVLSLLASKVYTWFRLPVIAEAAHFSIETNPRGIFEAFGVDKPFGCHAWERYDRDFFLDRFPEEFSRDIVDS